MTKKRLHVALRQSKERRPAAFWLSKKRRPAAFLRLPKESWHAALRLSPRSLGRTSCRTVRRVSSRSQHRTPLPSCSPAPPLSPSPESPPGFKTITKSRWDISKVLPRQTCSFQTCSGACQMKSVNKPTKQGSYEICWVIFRRFTEFCGLSTRNNYIFAQVQSK